MLRDIFISAANASARNHHWAITQTTQIFLDLSPSALAASSAAFSSAAAFAAASATAAALVTLDLEGLDIKNTFTDLHALG